MIITMYDFINIKEYNYSNKFQLTEMIILSLASFFIPLFLGHQQLIVGTVVNAFLISAALHLKGWKVLPVIIMPSLGAVAAGLLFGPLSKFLLIMVPFIWIGNTLLVLSIKKFKNNYWFKLGIGAGIKSLFLFSAAFILYILGALPIIFLTAMGILQLTTALVGGVISFGYENLVTTLK
jgi:hypothetical protein